MKSILFAFCAILLFISACTPNNKAEETVLSDLKKQTTFPFSDSVKKDTFSVEIIGNNTKNMQLLFTIKAFNGKEIYREKIETAALLKNYIAAAELKKESEKLKFLKEEIAYFFEEQHFLEPAVTASEQPDKNAPDPSFYTELKETGLNGFDYRLGKDTNVYIAWSVKEQKVKVYYKCC